MTITKASRLENFLLLLALAALAVLVSCAVGSDTVRTVSQPLQDEALAKLNELLADGKLTPELHAALAAQLELMMQKMAEKVAVISQDLSAGKWFDYAGILLSSVVGSRGLSRIRRGVSLFTGRQINPTPAAK